jgi:acyl-coenzyme A synthetase/AMP-(fatty) acid ligase
MAAHGTYRTSGLGSGGPVTSIALSADMPMDELADRLNRYQPDALCTYPTALSLLAAAQAEGQLKIDPRAIGIGGEVRLPGLAGAVARGCADGDLRRHGDRHGWRLLPGVRGAASL